MLATVPPIAAGGAGRWTEATPRTVPIADQGAFEIASARAADRAHPHHAAKTRALRAAAGVPPARTAAASAGSAGTVASGGGGTRIADASTPATGTSTSSGSATRGVDGGGATRGVSGTSATGGIPAATAGTVVVHDGAELARALASAEAGEHIVLADGTYAAPGGGFRLTASGTRDAPVVVEAEHALGARLTSSLTLAGSDQVASGLVLDRSSVTIAGDRSRVTGCKSVDATGDAIVISSGVDTRVDHCEISGGQQQGISIKPNPNHPDALLRPVIDHNYVHDWASVSDPNVHAAISIGEDWRNNNIKVGAVVDSNLLQNIDGAHCAIEAKSSDNIIRGNTLLDSRAAIVVRHGSDNTVVGNWVEGSGGIWIRGINTLVVGNTVTGSHGTGLRVLAGDVSADMPSKGYPAASGTVLIGNDVDRLLIGYGYADSTYAAAGTRIEGSQGAAPTLVGGLARDTIELPASGEEIPTAVRLGAADVGLGGTSTPGSVLAGYSGPGGSLPVTVVGAGPGAPGDRVLAGMLGRSANGTHAGGNLDTSQVLLAEMVLAQLNALMRQLNVEGV